MAPSSPPPTRGCRGSEPESPGGRGYRRATLSRKSRLGTSLSLPDYPRFGTDSEFDTLHFSELSPGPEKLPCYDKTHRRIRHVPVSRSPHARPLRCWNNPWPNNPCPTTTSTRSSWFTKAGRPAPTSTTTTVTPSFPTASSSRLPPPRWRDRHRLKHLAHRQEADVDHRDRLFSWPAS